MQSSAESWGTGRAVARIPRVPGGGTHRAGQGAFGNMCRKGRRFAPTRIWRKWHRRVHTGQKRFAVASALAASAIAPLVQARGHRIDSIPEIPFVIANESIETIGTTKKAVAFLKAIGAFPDQAKAKGSLQQRAGRGKSRNRRYRHRLGPLIVHTLTGDAPLLRAFRNLTGLDFQHVDALNPLVLAPGGHVGRFIIWTKTAFEQLDSLFGTLRGVSQRKADYRLPRSIMTNDDISRIIKSDQVMSVARPYKRSDHTWHPRKRNPFTHRKNMRYLNPYHERQVQLITRVQKRNIDRKLAVKAERQARKAHNRGLPVGDPKRIPKKKEPKIIEPRVKRDQRRVARGLPSRIKPDVPNAERRAKKLAAKAAAAKK